MSHRHDMADSTVSGILPADVEELRRSVEGDVLVTGDHEYETARLVWNGMIDRHPAVIVRCTRSDDIVAAVRFARAHRVPVSIRGGGHNVAGHAVCDDGVMIDLSRLRGVQVDAPRRRARVEGGATWRDVDRETQAFGLAVPGGLISDTGVAGLTLSGGIGWLRSRHGLTIDNLVAADVVTADGRLVHASADENADLLWALKGGGGQLRRRRGIRVRPASGRSKADVLRTALSAHGRERADSLLARLHGRQER